MSMHQPIAAGKPMVVEIPIDKPDFAAPAILKAGTIRVNCRWLIQRDHPFVTAIERDAFGGEWAAWNEVVKVTGNPNNPDHPQPIMRPFTAQDLASWAKVRSCIAMVAEAGDDVLGWMLFELMPRSIHLLRLMVHPGYLRCGIGRQMARRVCEKSLEGVRVAVVLDVDEHNLTGQLFASACGFRWMRTWKGRGVRLHSDTYRMVFRRPQTIEATPS